MTEKLFRIVKSCWSLKIFLLGKYIKNPLELHAHDIDGVLDQIWAEEMFD